VIARIDSPSDTSAPSRTTGSEAPAKTSVPPVAPSSACVVVAPASSSSSSPPQPAATSANASAMRRSKNLSDFPLTISPFTSLQPLEAAWKPMSIKER
jgi:hypothetical protein